MKNSLIYLLCNSEPDVKKNWGTVLRAGAPLHVHVRDNGSTDGSVALFEQSGIPIHKNPTNVGFTKGINQSIQAIMDREWEFVFILNPDVSCPDHWLVKMLAELTSRPNVGIVGARIVNALGNVEHTGGIVGKPELLYWPMEFDVRDGWSVLGRTAVCPTRFRHRTTDCKQAETVPWVTFAAVGLRRKMIEQIGLLDETYVNYSSDSEYCMRAWQNGWGVLYQPVTFTHEGGASVKRLDSVVHRQCISDLRTFSRVEETYSGCTHFTPDGP